MHMLGLLLGVWTAWACAEGNEAEALGNTAHRERARDAVTFLAEEIVLDVPAPPPHCDLLNLDKRRIDVGGCELYCEIEGKGTPVVLLHGGPGATHHGFHPWFSRATEFARVVYYDQRGCGVSDYLCGEGYSLDQATDDLEALRKSLGFDRWIVLGHSYGGLLAQYYATRYPDSLEGMVLVCSSVALQAALEPSRQWMFISAEEQERIGQIYGRGDLNLVQAVFNNHLNGDWKRQSYYRPDIDELARMARYEWKHDEEFRGALCGQAQELDLMGAFEQCSIPTLILEGTWDLTWNTDKPGILKANHPNARLVMFEESAHSPFADEPERFFALLREFVTALPPVQRDSLAQWKTQLAEWNADMDERKKDPFLETGMTKQERETIVEFERLRASIFEGTPFTDQSTPARACISMFSAYWLQDESLYDDPAHWRLVREPGGAPPDYARLLRIYDDARIARIPVQQRTPQPGDMWPVYLSYAAGADPENVLVFEYGEGKWRLKFNMDPASWQRMYSRVWASRNL